MITKPVLPTVTVGKAFVYTFCFSLALGLLIAFGSADGDASIRLVASTCMKCVAIAMVFAAMAALWKCADGTPAHVTQAEPVLPPTRTPDALPLAVIRLVESKPKPATMLGNSTTGKRIESKRRDLKA